MTIDFAKNMIGSARTANTIRKILVREGYSYELREHWANYKFRFIIPFVDHEIMISCGEKKGSPVCVCRYATSGICHFI